MSRYPTDMGADLGLMAFLIFAIGVFLWIDANATVVF